MYTQDTEESRGHYINTTSPQPNSLAISGSTVRTINQAQTRAATVFSSQKYAIVNPQPVTEYLQHELQECRVSYRNAE